jgi:hypothetical protein
MVAPVAQFARYDMLLFRPIQRSLRVTGKVKQVKKKKPRRAKKKQKEN